MILIAHDGTTVSGDIDNAQQLYKEIAELTSSPVKECNLTREEAFRNVRKKRATNTSHQANQLPQPQQ